MRLTKGNSLIVTIVTLGVIFLVAIDLYAGRNASDINESNNNVQEQPAFEPLERRAAEAPAGMYNNNMIVTPPAAPQGVALVTQPAAPPALVQQQSKPRAVVPRPANAVPPRPPQQPAQVQDQDQVQQPLPQRPAAAVPKPKQQQQQQQQQPAQPNFAAQRTQAQEQQQRAKPNAGGLRAGKSNVPQLAPRTNQIPPPPQQQPSHYVPDNSETQNEISELEVVEAEMSKRLKRATLLTGGLFMTLGVVYKAATMGLLLF